MTVQMNVLGVKKAKNFINAKNRRLGSLINKGIRKASFFLHGQVKDSIFRGTNAPVAVDTSLFGNTIQLEQLNKFNAVIFSQVPYAKFIEFGTSRMMARPHFRNTKDKNKHKVSRMIGKEIKNI